LKDKLRIDIALGDGGVGDNGEDLFKPEYKERIEFTPANLKYKKEIYNQINRALKKIWYCPNLKN